MEKVMFILVLALSMCLGQQDAGVTPPVGPAVTPATAVTPPVGSPASPAAEASTNPPGATTSTNSSANSKPGLPITTQPPSVAPDASKANKTNTSDSATKPSSTTEAPITTPATQSPKDNSSAHDTTTPKQNDSLPNGDKAPQKNDTATTKPPSSHDESVVVQTRAFDGPSFIGGIILTLGILAIGFMGFKYYRNQTERNYHTL